jgi:hypothetical protein
MKTTSSFFLLFGMFLIIGISYGQEVKLNTNMVVETDGTMRMDGAATVWDDLMVYPDATSRGGSKAPVWGGVTGTAFKKNGTSQGVFLWMFSSTTEQEVYFTIQLPHSYKVGSAIKPHVHWTTTTGTLNHTGSNPYYVNVVWGLEYTVIAIGGTFPNTTLINSNKVISTTAVTGQHLITPIGDIAGTNFGISTVLVCRLYREVGNTSDTFVEEVGLLGFDIHYEKDTQGSRVEFEK